MASSSQQLAVTAIALGVSADGLDALGWLPNGESAGRRHIGDVELREHEAMAVWTTISIGPPFLHDPVLHDPVLHDPAPSASAGAAVGAHGVTHIDHLVLATSAMDATLERFEAAGLTTRHVAKRWGRRQAFLWIPTPNARLILEVLEDADAPAQGAWWGITVVSRDIDAAAALWGLAPDSVHPAVQPGRRIASVPLPATSRCTPGRLAVMSPHARRPGKDPIAT